MKDIGPPGEGHKAGSAGDTYEGDDARGGGGEAVKVELGLTYRFERGDQIRKSLGSDARYSRVDCGELDRGLAMLRRQDADDVVGMPRGRREQCPHAVFGGREQRQTVAPLIAERQLVELEPIGFDGDAIGGQRVSLRHR